MSKNTQIYSNLTLPNTLSLEKALNENNCVIKLEYLLVLHSFTLHLFEQNASLKIVLVIGLKQCWFTKAGATKNFTTGKFQGKKISMKKTNRNLAINAKFP